MSVPSTAPGRVLSTRVGGSAEGLVRSRERFLEKLGSQPGLCHSPRARKREGQSPEA